MTEIKHKIKKKQKYNLFFHLYHYDPEPGCPNGHGCHQHPLLLSPFLHPPTPQTTPPIHEQYQHQLHGGEGGDQRMRQKLQMRSALQIVNM